MLFRKKKDEPKNIPICSLLDANAVVRTFFDVEADYDKQFPILYFMMYDIKDKKKKRMSDIVVSYKKNRLVLKGLIKFLKSWDNFKEMRSFYLDCDCCIDLMKFVKIRKEVYSDDEDSLYIDYYVCSNGRNRKNQVVNVHVTKQQAVVLANQLERFLTKKDKQ